MVGCSSAAPVHTAEPRPHVVVRASISKPAPPSSSAANANPPPLTGPDVIAAQLFAGGHGYVRTAQSLLWTDNRGASWRNITPAGLTEAQLQSAAIAVLPDGQAWIAVTPVPGSRSLSLLRRSTASQSWTTVRIPFAALTTAQNAGVITSLSFTDPDNGWLLVGEQIMHAQFGELLHTTDGGASWVTQASQRTLPVIGTIHFLTRQVGYLDANGSMGARGWWTTQDAGQSWRQLQLPAPATKGPDPVDIISPPTLAGNAIVVAARFETPAAGDDDGVGIYRSTDQGATWTVHPWASETPTEGYDFAATPNGSSYLLLRSQPAADSQNFSWVISRSTDGGRSFTDATSVHSLYPGPLSLASDGDLWTVAGANGCQSFKAGCWSITTLIASDDGGANWYQVKLAS
jgi:photosystem II stability/assembly factor-like uncharacterized protein